MASGYLQGADYREKLNWMYATGHANPLRMNDYGNIADSMCVFLLSAYLRYSSIFQEFKFAFQEINKAIGNT